MIGPSPVYVEEVIRQGRPTRYVLRRLGQRVAAIGSKTLALHMVERHGYPWLTVEHRDVIPGQIDIEGRIAA